MTKMSKNVKMFYCKNEFFLKDLHKILNTFWSLNIGFVDIFLKKQFLDLNFFCTFHFKTLRVYMCFGFMFLNNLFEINNLPNPISSSDSDSSFFSSFLAAE